MKVTFLFYLVISFFQFSCVFSNYEEQHRQAIQRELDSLSLIQARNESGINQIDYSKLQISKDSLDIKLYELIAYSAEMSEESILKNMDILIQKGAKPDALVEITYSVRKPGTYIPIIKEFYNNKYRNYTTATTSVHAAAGSGRIFIMKKLVNSGARMNIVDKDGSYPIDIAIKSNDVIMVNYLAEAGADLKKANMGVSENITLIEQLVKAGANPKTIDINFALNDRPVLIRLLAMKPDINNSELDFGIIMKNDELFDLLIANGLSPMAQGKFPDACPAIILAIKYDNFRAFKKLHSMGADLKVSCRAGFGETPLQIAISYQRIDILKYLIEKKINPNEKDWTGKSALYLACNTDNDQIINMLIDAGANIEHHEYFDKTPLMESANSGKYISAQCLINRKANVNFKNKYDETALVMAIKKNDLAMIKLLVESGANISTTYESKSLVELAQKENSPPMIIEYLKKQTGK